MTIQFFIDPDDDSIYIHAGLSSEAESAFHEFGYETPATGYRYTARDDPWTRYNPKRSRCLSEVSIIEYLRLLGYERIDPPRFVENGHLARIKLAYERRDEFVSVLTHYKELIAWTKETPVLSIDLVDEAILTLEAGGDGTN